MSEFKLDPKYVDRILTLAAVIEKSKTYDQGSWANDPEQGRTCGTPACVAGHAAWIACGGSEEVYAALNNQEIISDVAAAWMGIDKLTFQKQEDGDEWDEEVAGEMFDGTPLPYEGGGIVEPTNAHAAAMLRHFVTTGVVDWIGTKPK